MSKASVELATDNNEKPSRTLIQDKTKIKAFEQSLREWAEQAAEIVAAQADQKWNETTIKAHHR